MENSRDSKNSVISDFLPRLKQLIQSESVFGEPYKINDVTVIPVNSVKVGFAYGGKQNDGSEGGAGGGGIQVIPVAFLIVRGDSVTLQPISAGGGLETLIERLPDLLERTYSLFNKIKNSKEESPKSEKNAEKQE